MPSAPTPPAPLTNPLQRLAGYQLRRASLMVAADLSERLEFLGLTVVSLSVLLLIEANPGITQSQLGRMLAIKTANMAPLAAQFTSRRLIARQAADGRSHGLQLTPDGKFLAKQAWACVEANEAKYFGPNPARRIEELGVAIRRWS